MSNGADHPETGDHWHTVTLRVDGHERRIVVDVRTTLLDALRDRIGCMSPKKGCDHGQCGSCTVLLDSRRVVTCLALAVSHDGADIVTAAGLAERPTHPLHDAFVDHDPLAGDQDAAIRAAEGAARAHTSTRSMPPSLAAFT